MTRRNRQADSLKVEPPAPTGTGNPDGARARRSRTHVQTRTGTLQDEEQFNLSAISGSEDESDDERDADPTIPTAQRSSRTRINDPDAIPSRKAGASDIHYFFEKTGGKNVCKICRQVFLRSQLLQFSELTTDNIILREAREADPSNWPADKHYQYALTTSTTSLRPHIEKYHLELYKTLAKENGWKILLPGLVSQARSQASVETATQGKPLDEFNVATFHQYLLNFIVADDQVCFRLIFFMFIMLMFALSDSQVSISCGMSRVQTSSSSSSKRSRRDDDSPSNQLSRAYCSGLESVLPSLKARSCGM